MRASSNRGAVYLSPGKIEIQNTPYPKMRDSQGRQIGHGAILRAIPINICGSDQHMVRGHITTPEDLVLGHEVTGEVVEIRRGVETMKIGDLVLVPFNVIRSHCRTCREQHAGICLTVSPAWAGDVYGYVDMDGWVGGQAEYVLVSYIDLNLLKLPDREVAMEKIRNPTCPSSILPAGYHGAVITGVDPDSTVYTAGAGPVDLAAAASARLPGAAVAIVGDVNLTRLTHVKKQGFEIVDPSKDTPLYGQIAALLSEPEVDCAIDAVGFEARGRGHPGSRQEAPATVLSSLMGIIQVAGEIGIPGLYVTEDPSAVDAVVKHGTLSIRFDLGWTESYSFHTGQIPVMKHNRQPMQTVMWNWTKTAGTVGAEVVILDGAPKGYGEFGAGVPKKSVIDLYNLLRAA